MQKGSTKCPATLLKKVVYHRYKFIFFLIATDDCKMLINRKSSFKENNIKV